MRIIICIKKFMLVLILIVVNNYIYGFEPVDDNIGANILPFGGSLNISDNMNFTGEFNISLFTFSMEDKIFRLGFEFIPIRYSYVYNNHIFSLFQINGYWNIFGFLNKIHTFFDSSIFGPFVSLDYPNLILFEKFSFKNYTYRFGLKYTWKVYYHGIFVPIIKLEGGIRDISGLENRKYFIGIQLGLFM